MGLTSYHAGTGACNSSTLCLKNNDVAHYNFDADQPIIIIFGRDVAERVCQHEPWKLSYHLIVYRKLLKLADACRRYSKPKQCRFWDMVYSMTKKTISGVHVSLNSAEILVRRDGIANHHLIAYSLSNISAKNYQNRLMCIEVIACNISVVFRHSIHIMKLCIMHM